MRSSISRPGVDSYKYNQKDRSIAHRDHDASPQGGINQKVQKRKRRSNRSMLNESLPRRKFGQEAILLVKGKWVGNAFGTDIPGDIHYLAHSTTSSAIMTRARVEGRILVAK